MQKLVERAYSGQSIGQVTDYTLPFYPWMFPPIIDIMVLSQHKHTRYLLSQ